MKIAIQGHLTRGKEVIQILESLGGKNIENLKGVYKTFYYIDDKNEIGDDHKRNFPPTYKLYTLEEFEKEFPFKVGDLCIYYSSFFNKEIVVKILGMAIENDCIMYEVGYKDTIVAHSGIYKSRHTLKPYKEMKEERNITLTLDKAKEWYKKDGELREIALQAFSEKELNPLPKTWEEFYEQYKFKNSLNACLNAISTNFAIKYVNEFEAFLKLQYLRDCWRQDWKPDWQNTNEKKYAIRRCKNENSVEILYITHAFLSFPTYELALEFQECFRDLIEKAGDLI